MQFNEEDFLATSMLGIAACTGDEDSLEQLLKNGSRIDLGDNRGWNAIHQAAARHHIGCVKILLRKGPQHINRKTMEGETPLLLACKHEGGIELIRVLIENGANVNLGDNESFAPLHIVCKNGNLEIAVLLVESGARISALNYNNWTPLHFAVSEKHVDVMKYLISKGADVTIKDECGRTPLFLACEVCDMNIVEPLLQHYENVNTRANDGATALMLAAQCGNLEVVQELLNRGADPNLIARDKTMALHLAVHAGALNIVELLLDVTSTDAIVASSKIKKRLRMREINNSLCCLAIDSENLEVLQALLASDLGNYILNLPVHISPRFSISDFLIGRPKSFDLNFTCLPPISFLLQKKVNDFGEDTIKYLELLLEHNFPVNTRHETELPPIVAIADQDEDNEVVMTCVDILMSHGANIDFTTEESEIPEALRSACVSGKCSMVLKLLNVGSSGLPDDLLEYLIENTYLDEREDMAITKMVNFLLGLGITRPDLYGHLQTYFDSSGVVSSKRKLSKPLGEFQLCSLQQLSRVAVRKHLNLPLSASLDKLAVPNSIKDYLLYKLQ